MITVKKPYELLFRWREYGTVAAHIQYRFITYADDGETVVADTVGEALPAGEAGTDFPISEAVANVLADGLLKVIPKLDLP